MYRLCGKNGMRDSLLIITGTSTTVGENSRLLRRDWCFSVTWQINLLKKIATHENCSVDKIVLVLARTTANSETLTVIG